MSIAIARSWRGNDSAADERDFAANSESFFFAPH
jgi:hypothetical protein